MFGRVHIDGMAAAGSVWVAFIGRRSRTEIVEKVRSHNEAPSSPIPVTLVNRPTVEALEQKIMEHRELD